MGNVKSIPKLEARKKELQNTIVEYNIVIRKEQKYGAPYKERVDYLKQEIERMSEELEQINKRLQNGFMRDYQ